MIDRARRLLATALVATLLSSIAARAETHGLTDIIVPADPRFNVFELSNSAGDRTFASPVGTVLLSFISKDRRYCRSARFPADKSVVLACREEGGWKVEAISDLMASVEPLDEFEVIEAASKGWRNPVPVDEQAFDARDILRKTAQVYRTSKSYTDTGTVQTVYKNSTNEWTGETRFKTAYVAPFEFRFESTMRDMPGAEAHFIAWRNEEGVKVWYNLDPDMQGKITSIQSALDAGAGISRDASGMIPGLIIPGTKLGGDIVQLTDAVRLEDIQIDGFDCFQLQGFRWPNTGRPTTVWIDKASFLIRRVYEEQEIKGDLTKTTWFYKPAINVPVAEEALALK